MGFGPLDCALALLLLGLAEPAVRAGAADGARDGGEARAGATADGGDELQPPPGEAADQALWRSGGQASADVVVARTEAARVQLRVRAGRLLERLEAGAAGPGGARHAELRARVLAAWNESYEVLTRRWPVDPTRGCSYQVMLLESAMRTPERMARRADLGLAREDLAECVARAGLAASAMQRATEALRAVADEAERALGEAPAGPGPSEAAGRAP